MHHLPPAPCFCLADAYCTAAGSGSGRPKTKARTEETVCKVGPKMRGRQVAMQTDLLNSPSPLTHVGGDGPHQLLDSLGMIQTFH